MNGEYNRIHRHMKVWVQQQEIAGWRSPEVENYAHRVLCGLWACAHNTPIHPQFIQALAEDTEALARARAGSAMVMH